MNHKSEGELLKFEDFVQKQEKAKIPFQNCHTI